MRPLTQRHSPRPASRAHGRRGGFTMAEMLVVMAIITILAASLAVILPKVRSRAMSKAAQADIHLMEMALEELHKDRGRYPSAPYGGDASDTTKMADYVLFKTLTDPDYSPSDPSGTVAGDGWGGARNDWEFIRGDSAAQNHILDPWGVPFYYIPHTDYLAGVRINDSTEDTAALPSNVAMYYGTTPRPDDYKGPSSPDNLLPPTSYYGPPPKIEEFYNATTFQIHSKGPDQSTDTADAEPGKIDPCDRGTDPDDVNNFGGVHVDQPNP